MTALSELLQDARRKLGGSVDDLIVAAEKRRESGEPIPSTFRSLAYKVLNGDHARNPREDTLLLLAEVFDLDIRDVRVAAGKPAGELGPWVPVAESARLAQPVRDALDDLIKALTRGGEADGEAAPNTEDPPDDGGSVIDLPTPKTPGGDSAAGRRERRPAARNVGKGTAAQRKNGETT